ncbi:5555_t:CDS:2 [Diversispora eburnea]|uniref:5555_t:CDS:1 n=1 Tax=Diversispora eburnea TaxID=1213867 RepID=A0A9N8V3I3_9GLOM|nr:5555_t:CDS:2 [Diversispora eburnea]
MNHLFKNKRNFNNIIKQLHLKQQPSPSSVLLFTQQKRQVTHHAPEWNEPSVKEEWENVWVYGMGGCFFVQTWATKEAEKRLKDRGISLDYPKTERKW